MLPPVQTLHHRLRRQQSEATPEREQNKGGESVSRTTPVKGSTRQSVSRTTVVFLVGSPNFHC